MAPLHYYTILQLLKAFYKIYINIVHIFTKLSHSLFFFIFYYLLPKNLCNYTKSNLSLLYGVCSLCFFPEQVFSCFAGSLSNPSTVLFHNARDFLYGTISREFFFFTILCAPSKGNRA